MRPIDPGPWPMTDHGDNIVYDEYSQAKPHLSRRLGDYCSYCEMRVYSSLAIEHIASKHSTPALKRDWSNFLLACVNCNSTKGEKVKTMEDTAEYLWPTGTEPSTPSTTPPATYDSPRSTIQRSAPRPRRLAISSVSTDGQATASLGNSSNVDKTTAGEIGSTLTTRPYRRVETWTIPRLRRREHCS